MTTPTTPEAALAAVMFARDSWGGSLRWYVDEAADYLAAMPCWALVNVERRICRRYSSDGKMLCHHHSDLGDCFEAEIARLRTALESVCIVGDLASVTAARAALGEEER